MTENSAGKSNSAVAFVAIIGRRYMVDIFTLRNCSIMAASATVNDVAMIKADIQHTKGGMTVITGIDTANVVYRFTNCSNTIVTG